MHTSFNCGSSECVQIHYAFRGSSFATSFLLNPFNVYIFPSSDHFCRFSYPFPAVYHPPIATSLLALFS
ncbi:hypothetical protein CW304_27225 [Bacillus sp. UFRGS-B20]|nr:hypothetical protein CW304_27225 [Bacillus sp. UFRGS-B20]